MRKRVREVEEKLVVLEDMRRKSAEEGRMVVLLKQSSVNMTGQWQKEQKEKAVREQSEGELDVVRKDESHFCMSFDVNFTRFIFSPFMEPNLFMYNMFVADFLIFFFHDILELIELRKVHQDALKFTKNRDAIKKN